MHLKVLSYSAKSFTQMQSRQLLEQRQYSESLDLKQYKLAPL